jgi:hypothetical protein
MKNFPKITLSLILLSTISLTSCSKKDLDKKPDAIYEITINNPEIGASSGLNETSSPLAGVEKKGNFDFLFKKKKEDKAKIKDKSSKQKQELVENKQLEKPQESGENFPINDQSVTYAVPENSNIQVTTIEGSASENTAIEKPKAITTTQIVKAETAKPIEEIKTEAIEAPQLAMPASLAFKQQVSNKAEVITYKKEVVKEAAVNQPKEIAQKNEDNKKDEKEIAEVASYSTLPSAEDLPVGQCITKVTIFGETKEVEENILVKEAYTKQKKIPAKYKEVEEEVVIKEASTELIEIPATYKTIEEEVVVKEAKEKETVTPAVYKEVKERVLVSPAKKVWQTDSKDENLKKLVEIPAVFKDEVRKELVKEEVRETKTIPAVTKKVKKKVVDEPARTEKRTIAAVTKKIKKQVLVADARIKNIEVPAVYKKQIKKIKVNADKEEWQPALCKDAGKEQIKKLQGALAAKGYKIKSIDGIMGVETTKAIRKFQKTLGFESDNITLTALNELGL